MNKKLLLAGLLPVLALGACGGNNNAGENTAAASNVATIDQTDPMLADGNGTAGDNATVAASPGEQFANEAGASDYYEVEAGKLAQEKAQAQPLKDFGKLMVEHHTASTEKLKAAAGKADPAIVPNPVLGAEQEANLAALRQAEGAAFDALYKTQQVAAHEKALALMQGYAATGDVPALKTFASETSKVVQAHLTKAKSL